MLIILSGLPGVGKTAIARRLADQLGAIHLRVDSIEQALRESGLINGPLNDLGYRVAYAVAEDNLRLGRTVIADSVNPIQLTRDAWRKVAAKAAARAIEIEVKCSDVEEHRGRAAKRSADIPGFVPPAWEEIVSREYHPWDRKHIVVETAACTVEECVGMIESAIRNP